MQGLRIVKAALTSTTALTDGLIKPLYKKQVHREMEEKIGVEEVLFLLLYSFSSDVCFIYLVSYK